MAQATEIAAAFTTFYYQTFDSNRSGLGSLYRENSMLTFEGNQTSGAANIVERLTSLPFAKVQHQVSTTDAQPASQDGAILVSVTGALLVDDESKPQMFSQTFTLYPDGNGSYYVLNDIFRLVYA